MTSWRACVHRICDRYCSSDTDKLASSYRRRILRSPCLHRVSLCTKGRWRRHGAADDYLFKWDSNQHEMNEGHVAAVKIMRDPNLSNAGFGNSRQAMIAIDRACARTKGVGRIPQRLACFSSEGSFVQLVFLTRMRECRRLPASAQFASHIRL